MKILVINCGSSSLKFQVIDSETEAVLAKGLCERIGIDGSLTYAPAGGEKLQTEVAMPTHVEAIESVLNSLVDPEIGILKTLDEIDAVGHRVVHGGESFSKAALVTDEVEKIIEDLNDLAPLHNPANMIGIRSCQKVLPNVPHVVVFDTAFHQTMPKKAYLYAVPYNYYTDYKVRRYGFHGTSHQYVSERTAELMGKKLEDSKIIVCHLGNGASITAIDGGKSVDTSMGLSPLEGLMMGTRSGDIDPAAIQLVAKKENMDIDTALNVLNKQSGLLGLSGVSSDFRDILKAMNEGDEKAQDAFDSYVYRVAKYIGSYITALHGVDGIAFTAGIGENNALIREKVMEYFDYLGVKIDPEANKVMGEEQKISTDDSKIAVFVVPTNEELSIARQTVEVVESL